MVSQVLPDGLPGKARAALSRYGLLILGTGLLTGYLWGLDFELLGDRIAGFSVAHAVAVVLLNLVLAGVKVLRWRFLLGELGLPRSEPLQDYLAVNAAFFLGLVTPGTVGEVARAKIVTTDTAPALGVVVYEKVADLAVLLVLAVLSLAAVTGPWIVAGAAAGAAGALLGGRLLVLRVGGRGDGVVARLVRKHAPEGIDRLSESYESFHSLLSEGRATVLSLAYSVVLWLVPLLQMFLLYDGLGVELSPSAVAVSYFLPYLIGVLSMIPLGLGVFDLGLDTFAGTVGSSAASHLSLAPAFYRLLVTLPLVLLGYVSQLALAVTRNRAATNQLS